MTSPTIDDPGIVLGIMRFGTDTDEKTAFWLLDADIDQGGQWLETADCYSSWADPDGRSGHGETVLGRWLRAGPVAGGKVRIAPRVGCIPVRISTGARAELDKPW